MIGQHRELVRKLQQQIYEDNQINYTRTVVWDLKLKGRDIGRLLPFAAVQSLPSKGRDLFISLLVLYKVLVESLHITENFANVR